MNMIKQFDEFVGVVDKIEDEVAYCTLMAVNDGEILNVEFMASDLERYNIKERRRFKCRSYVELEAIPDIEISEKEIEEYMSHVDNTNL
jgi:hypothetical protein